MPIRAGSPTGVDMWMGGLKIHCPKRSRAFRLAEKRRDGLVARRRGRRSPRVLGFVVFRRKLWKPAPVLGRKRDTGPAQQTLTVCPLFQPLFAEPGLNNAHGGLDLSQPTVEPTAGSGGREGSAPVLGAELVPLVGRGLR